MLNVIESRFGFNMIDAGHGYLVAEAHLIHGGKLYRYSARVPQDALPSDFLRAVAEKPLVLPPLKLAPGAYGASCKEICAISASDISWNGKTETVFQMTGKSFSRKIVLIKRKLKAIEIGPGLG